GNGMQPGVEIGPVIHRAAQLSFEKAISQAVEEGARLLAETPLPELPNGSFVKPTVLELESGGYTIWKEEVFGPVLAIRRISDLDEAIANTNDTQYGLSASLFSNDYAAIERAIAEIEVGVLHINGPTIGADPHVPFGGRGASGYGPKEQGKAAL